MQNILIPTDFSPIADNALNYAIEIATKFKSEIYLYHVYSMNKKRDYDWSFPEDEQPYVKELERKMDLTKQKIIETITQNGLSIQTKVEENDIYSLFERLDMEHEVNLIVMGSKGASGLEKIVFGSVAASALDLSEVPVLIVPPKHSSFPLKQIVLAIDSKEVSTSLLAPLQKLAFKFGAKVTILYVNTGKGTHKNMNLSIKDVETTYKEVPMSKNINESINEFIKKNKCDLLCMIRREKGFLQSIFQQSITKNQVYKNEFPLLVLPEVLD